MVDESHRVSDLLSALPCCTAFGCTSVDEALRNLINYTYIVESVKYL